MKISACLFVAALADERKVPPRTPAQRLNTLHRFATEWIQQEIAGTINRPSRAQNMINRGITRLEARITDASKKDCFFFDPSLEHGGPRPQSQRKRRSAWIDNELERIRRQVEENEDLDFFDRYFEAQQKNNGERGFSLDQEFQERLAQEPNLAWKQIGTGFRKWILRYISECNGQATYSYHTSRLAKVHGNVKEAYETVGQADYDGDYGLEESY